MASLNDIREALLAALEMLSRANGGDVVYVGELRGDASVGPEPGEIEQELGGRSSGLLLQLEADAPIEGLDVRTLSRGVAQQTTRSIWQVHACVLDARSAALEAKGSLNAIGLLDLVDRARGVLTGLRIAAPSATLSVRVTGTPSATVAISSDARLVANGVQYRALAPSVTLDGAGEALLSVKTATIGALGNQLKGTTLAWSTVPAGLGATAVVVALSTAGQNALWRSEHVRYMGQQLRGARPGQIAVRTLRFSAMHTLTNVTNPGSQAAPLLIDADINLTSIQDASNPRAEFQSP